MNLNTCILINSCSLYYNLIEPHLILLRKFWPDCLFNVYVNVDKQLPVNNLDEKYNFTYIKSNLEGKGNNIINRIINALEFISKKYDNVIFLLDDFFLVRKNNNQDILNLVNLINKEKNIGCIYLHPSPLPKKIKPNFYKSIDYQGVFKEKQYIDKICGCCIDKLYKPGVNFFPHRDADLWDDKITFIHKRKYKVNLYRFNKLYPQVGLWNINYLKNIFKNLIDPKNKIHKFKTDSEKKNNDWNIFEIFGNRMIKKKKINFFSSKVILMPENRTDIFYQNRGFKGSCIYRGWLVNWGRQLLEENDIKIKYFNGFFVIENDTIKNSPLHLNDKDHFNFRNKLNKLSKNKYLDK